MKGVAVIVGVGVGIGGEVAKKFAREGYKVAIIARNKTYKGADKLSPLKREIELTGGTVFAVPCDATKPDQVSRAFASIRNNLGLISVLVYNAGARKLSGETVLETSIDQFIEFWKVNCLGAFLTAREALPDMLTAGKGTIILTGATGSLRGSAGLSSFSVGKFGLRALAQTLQREYSKLGVHVAHVIVDAAVDIPIIRKAVKGDIERLASPKEIAKEYWHLHQQHKSAWVHELDLRPYSEKMFSKL